MKKVLSLLTLSFLVFMLSGCGQEENVVVEVETTDELMGTTEETVMADEEIFVDPTEEVGVPTIIPEELEEPTTAPPVNE